MIRRQNELGEIAVSNNVYTYIAGSAATNCFGVKGMAIRSMKDGLVHLLRRESLAKGVLVRTNEDGTIRSICTSSSIRREHPRAGQLDPERGPLCRLPADRNRDPRGQHPGGLHDDRLTAIRRCNLQ